MASIRKRTYQTNIKLRTVADSAERLAITAPASGEVVIQLDTSSLYVYDANSATWILVGPETLQTVYNNDQDIDLTSGAFALRDTNPGSGANLLEVTNDAGTVFYLQVDASKVTVVGLVDESLTANTVPYANASKKLISSAVTPTELGYVSGVTSAIQTQINGKQPTGNYITATTGDVVASGPGSVAATIQPGVVSNAKIADDTITNAKINSAAAISLSKLAALTINRLLVSDGSGVVSASSVTATEAGYLSGVSEALQTQINRLVPAQTTPAAIASSGTIPITSSKYEESIRIQGSGGAVVVSTTTGIANGDLAGRKITLIGLDNTNTVQLTSAGNVTLNGACTLAQNDLITLIWDAVSVKWVELSRGA